MGAVDRRPGEVQGVRPAEFGEENLAEPRPHTGLGPLGQATPAGHARTEAEFLRQVLPGDPGVRDEQDAWNTSRSGCRLRPGCRIRRSTLGSGGSINAHSSSSTSRGFGRATQHPRIISP
jgi:hypothetical protein